MQENYGKMKLQGGLPPPLAPSNVARPEAAQSIGFYHFLSFLSAAVRNAGRRAPHHPAGANLGSIPGRVASPKGQNKIKEREVK